MEGQRGEPVPGKWTPEPTVLAAEAEKDIFNGSFTLGGEKKGCQGYISPMSWFGARNG